MSCQSFKQGGKEYLIYDSFSFDSKESIGVDTLFIEQNKNDEFKITLKEESLYSKITDSYISLCDSSFNNCFKTYYLKDSSRLEISKNIENPILLFLPNDTRLVQAKTFMAGKEAVNVLKFKVNELHSEHSIKYSYFIEDFGFIAFIDYFEGFYFIVNVEESNLINMEKVTLEKVVKQMKRDSTFFEYPKYMPPPPLPMEQKYSRD